MVMSKKVPLVVIQQIQRYLKLRGYNIELEQLVIFYKAFFDVAKQNLVENETFSMPGLFKITLHKNIGKKLKITHFDHIKKIKTNEIREVRKKPNMKAEISRQFQENIMKEYE